MHGTIQAGPDSSALAEKMVIDPVCRMKIDPATAAASEVFEGKPVYFCAEGCRRRFLANPAALLASVLMLSLYFGALTLVSGWQFTVEQFADWWPYIVALATGFGIQVGLFVYLRCAVHGAASGKVIVATGTTSGAAMLACCTHYLVNLLPVLGATGLVSFVGAYQIELFWFGIASNLAGIAYIR